ncbi:PDZ domain-containing protein [Streptomyces sp. NPDC049687]|uniref:PDZ domain-containing protein n=1 Tax=Streptomyces sp. NPDC049687 TaxID=3365596 RepID=UPI003787DD18
MEQTALRPKPMPGREPGGGAERGGPAPRPHAARRRGRRLTTPLCAVFAGTVLVLAGVGLGTVGASVIGTSGPAEFPWHTGPGGAASPSGRPSPSVPAAPAPARATLGLEVVDTRMAGARIVAVHVPGPGHTAGLVRGDVLLAFGTTRIDSAADLARAVDEARPGREITLTVRHRSGGFQQLLVVPGVVV